MRRSGELVIHDFKRTTLGHTARVSYVFGFRLGSPPKRVGDHCHEDPMNRGTLLVSVATLLAAAGMGAGCAPGGKAISPASPTKAWSIAGGATFSPLRLESGKWGVAISNAGLASVSRPQPVELEFSPESNPGNILAGYDSVTLAPDGFTGRASIEGPARTRFFVADQWRATGPDLQLARTVTVKGNATNGFMSGFQFDFAGPRAWTNAEWFAPGMIYGGFDHLSDKAIGGKAHYKPGDYTVRIREDRLPAPLFLAHFNDNTWIAVLNSAPRGGTTAKDANDVLGVALTDQRFQFGAIGGQERKGRLSLGYWFPGSEGEVTYAGNTYPGGQLHQWRRRYHPIQDGLVQQYTVCFRLGRQQPFADAMSSAWRWAWQTLKPKVNRHDIGAVRGYSHRHAGGKRGRKRRARRHSTVSSAPSIIPPQIKTAAR